MRNSGGKTSNVNDYITWEICYVTTKHPVKLITEFSGLELIQ